jgi:tetratricopeptide (TPR) repeat protein
VQSAQAEAKRAFEQATALPREERLLIEARWQRAVGAWGEAVRIYRALYEFYPDNLEYGLALAEAQLNAGGPEIEGALATLAALQKLPPPAGADPRIDVAIAETARPLGDTHRMLAAVEAAEHKCQALGARLLLARARVVEGQAYDGLAQLDKSMAAYEDAKAIFAAASNRAGVASTVFYMAATLMDRGDNAKGLARFQEALADYRELGDRRGEARSMMGVGVMLQNLNDFDGALKNLTQALAVLREVGDRSNVAVASSNLGVLYFNHDDLRLSRARAEETLAEGRVAHANLTRFLINLGEVLVYLGELGEARKLFDEDLALAKASGQDVVRPELMRGTAEQMKYAGDFESAGRLLADARALAVKLDQGDGVVEDDSDLGSLRLLNGHAAEAEAPLRAAVEGARKLHLDADRCVAQGRLVEALLALGRRDEAERELAEASTTVRTLFFAPAHYQVEPWELELRLTVARLEHTSRAPGAKARAAALAHDAGAAGFLGIARAAAAL